MSLKLTQTDLMLLLSTVCWDSWINRLCYLNRADDDVTGGMDSGNKRQVDDCMSVCLCRKCSSRVGYHFWFRCSSYRKQTRHTEQWSVLWCNKKIEIFSILPCVKCKLAWSDSGDNAFKGEESTLLLFGRSQAKNVWEPLLLPTLYCAKGKQY